MPSWLVLTAAIAGIASGSAVVSRRPRSLKAEIEPAPYDSSVVPAEPTPVAGPHVCGTYQVTCDATLRRAVPSAAGCTPGSCVDCTQQLQAAGVNCATPPPHESSQCNAHCAGGMCPMFYLPVCVRLANGEVCTYSNDCVARDCGAMQWVTKPADRPCSPTPIGTLSMPVSRSLGGGGWSVTATVASSSASAGKNGSEGTPTSTSAFGPFLARFSARPHAPRAMLYLATMVTMVTMVAGC